MTLATSPFLGPPLRLEKWPVPTALAHALAATRGRSHRAWCGNQGAFDFGDGHPFPLGPNGKSTMTGESVNPSHSDKATVTGCHRDSPFWVVKMARPISR